MNCRRCGKIMKIKNFKDGRYYVCESCKVRYPVKNSATKKSKSNQKPFKTESNIIRFSFLILFLSFFTNNSSLYSIIFLLVIIVLFATGISVIIKSCKKPVKKQTTLKPSPTPDKPQNITPPDNYKASTPKPVPLTAPAPKPSTSSPTFKTENFHIAGTSFRQKEIEQLGHENPLYHDTKRELVDSGEIEEKIYLYEFFPTKVELIPEPDNEHDPNAIKVVIDGTHVGYIKKGSCPHVKKLLASGKIIDIDADIHGGKYKIIYEDYDYEKDKEVYEMETDKTDYFVSVSIRYNI